MAESVLRKSVRFEAAKHISSSVEDSMIEFEITGPVPGEDDKMSVMLVAAPNDMVESRLAALTLAGLEPVAIDVEAFALQRALLDLSPTRPGEGTDPGPAGHRRDHHRCQHHHQRPVRAHPQHSRLPATASPRR